MTGVGEVFAVVVLVILWAVMGFVGWKIGDGKGRPGLGLALGLLLGLIGLLIIALIRPAPPRSYAYAPLPNPQQYGTPTLAAPPVAPTFACPSCRAPISPAAAACVSCGGAVQPTALMPPPDRTPAQWLRDPSGRFVNRYWDGAQWNEWVQNQPNEYLTDPPVPSRHVGSGA